MSELMQMDCYDKYTWIFDEATAMLTCKRNGQDWRNETADGAILALLQTACETRDALQAENARYKAALEQIEGATIEKWSVYSDSLDHCETVIKTLGNIPAIARAALRKED